MPCVYNTVDSRNSSIHTRSRPFFGLVNPPERMSLMPVDQLEPVTRFQ